MTGSFPAVAIVEPSGENANAEGRGMPDQVGTRASAQPPKGIPLKAPEIRPQLEETR